MAQRKASTGTTSEGRSDTAPEAAALTPTTEPAYDPATRTPDQPAVGDLKVADATSDPVGLDTAEVHDPPVRTNRPDVPILSSLATGAGEHVPPDPETHDPDGRPKQPEDGWATAEGAAGLDAGAED